MKPTQAAVILGRLGGRSKSLKKVKASRRNGRKNGERIRAQA